MEKIFLTIKECADGYADGSLTAEGVARVCLDRIGERNDDLNAFVRLNEDALEQASEIDRRRASGEELGPLAGVPIGIKDNMVVQGKHVTASSQMLEGFVSPYDATVISRLKDAGAIVIGHTNMDEFAMGSTTETSHFGQTKNPWDVSKVPGGSSGGSAVAVADGMVSAALGSDTGGSVRQPASLCGVVGLKPTYGRVSRYGLIAMASSLDQIGPFARTVEDVALVMTAIEGKDPNDGTSVDLPQTTGPGVIADSIDGMKLGVPREYFHDDMDADVRQVIEDAIDLYKRNGAVIEEISMPHTSYALSAYYVLMPCEASSNLGRFDGLRYGYHSEGTDLEDTYRRSRGEGFGDEVKRRIMLGTYALSAGYYDAYYRKALKVRTLIKRDFDDALKRVDAIVTPTSPSVAWDIGEKFDDPLTMYLSDIYTVTANLATVPALSVPCGFVNNLPVGLQLMGRPFDEDTLYRLGAFYQSKTNWHRGEGEEG